MFIQMINQMINQMFNQMYKQFNFFPFHQSNIDFAKIPELSIDHKSIILKAANKINICYFSNIKIEVSKNAILTHFKDIDEKDIFRKIGNLDTLLSSTVVRKIVHDESELLSDSVEYSATIILFDESIALIDMIATILQKCPQTTTNYKYCILSPIVNTDCRGT